MGTYETEAKTLEVDQRDTVAPRVVPFRCPSRRPSVYCPSDDGDDKKVAETNQAHPLVGIYHIPEPGVDTIRKRIQQERPTFSLFKSALGSRRFIDGTHIHRIKRQTQYRDLRIISLRNNHPRSSFQRLHRLFKVCHE
jgi:hypothetical protein